jgi:hypothetical protein
VEAVRRQRHHKDKKLASWLTPSLWRFGVYVLGWWALLTFIAGAIFGGKTFWDSVKSGRINPEE